MIQATKCAFAFMSIKGVRIFFHCFFLLFAVLVPTTSLIDGRVSNGGVIMIGTMAAFFSSISCAFTANRSLMGFSQSIRGGKKMRSYGFVLMLSLILLEYPALLLLSDFAVMLFSGTLAVPLPIIFFSSGCIMLLVLPMITLLYKHPNALYTVYFVLCFSMGLLGGLCDRIDETFSAADNSGFLNSDVALFVGIGAIAAAIILSLCLSPLNNRFDGRQLNKRIFVK